MKKLNRLTCLVIIGGLAISVISSHPSQQPKQLIVKLVLEGDSVVSEVDPSIKIDLRYASDRNFLGKRLYPASSRCLLRPVVAEALSKVQAELKEQGLGLKLWDCYRPLSIQKRLWEMKPDPNYVADPAYGSAHNRGGAVDLTLVDQGGRELEMPTNFDDFSEKAHPGYVGASVAAQANAKKLAGIMVKHGFRPLSTEWWHFEWSGKTFPILDLPLGD